MNDFQTHTQANSHLNPQTIAICGCGIGGLTAGALLARQGHQVMLFDQFLHPQPLGSGLVIQPVAKPVLHNLGLLAQLEQHGAPITDMIGHEVDRGTKVLNVSYGKTHGLGLHRACLFEALYTAARSAGCHFQHDARIIGSTQQDTGRSLHLETGPSFGPFDLIIDAMGTGSTLSPMVRRPLAYGALWGTVDWPAGTAISFQNLTQKYRGAAEMLGVLPIGQGPGTRTKQAAIFWSLPTREIRNWRTTPLAVWKGNVLALWPEFAPFIEQITTHAQMTPARYSHGTLARPYSDKLVHIGDAAHSASPQLGQGANMALLDAYALALALQNAPLQQALPKYHAMRRRHVKLYQGLSYMLTPLYQSDRAWVAPLRDRLLSPLSTLPPMPRLLSRLVAGDLIPPIAGQTLAPTAALRH